MNARSHARSMLLTLAALVAGATRLAADPIPITGNIGSFTLVSTPQDGIPHAVLTFGDVHTPVDNHPVTLSSLTINRGFLVRSR